MLIVIGAGVAAGGWLLGTDHLLSICPELRRLSEACIRLGYP